MDYRTIRLRRDHASNWRIRIPILADGEPGVEKGTLRFKIGDGTTPWLGLAYYGTPLSDGGASDEAVLAHINAMTPHPIYDDLPSLTLLFENGLI